MLRVWVRRYGLWAGALSVLLACGAVVLISMLSARSGRTHEQHHSVTPVAAADVSRSDAVSVATGADTPTTAYAQAVLDALNCVRGRAAQPPLVLDPSLSRIATQLGQTQQDIAALPDAQVGGASLRVLLPLLADPAAPAVGPCSVGGLDLSPLQLDGVSVVGIAVFADPTATLARDFTTAVVLAR